MGDNVGIGFLLGREAPSRENEEEMKSDSEGCGRAYPFLLQRLAMAWRSAAQKDLLK